MMASSPVSAAAASPVSAAVAPIQSQTGQTTIDEVSRSSGTKRRRRQHLRPAAAPAPAPASADDQLASDQQHMYQLVRHLGELQQARNERDKAWHAEVLASLAAIRGDIQAMRDVVLAAISSFRNEVQACRTAIAYVLRFLGLGGSSDH